MENEELEALTLTFETKEFEEIIETYSVQHQVLNSSVWYYLPQALDLRYDEAVKFIENHSLTHEGNYRIIKDTQIAKREIL